MYIFTGFYIYTHIWYARFVAICGWIVPINQIFWMNFCPIAHVHLFPSLKLCRQPLHVQCTVTDFSTSALAIDIISSFLCHARFRAMTSDSAPDDVGCGGFPSEIVGTLMGCFRSVRVTVHINPAPFRPKPSLPKEGLEEDCRVEASGCWVKVVPKPYVGLGSWVYGLGVQGFASEPPPPPPKKKKKV